MGLQSHQRCPFPLGHCSNKDNQNCLQYLDFLKQFLGKHMWYLLYMVWVLEQQRMQCLDSLESHLTFFKSFLKQLTCTVPHVYLKSLLLGKYSSDRPLERGKRLLFQPLHWHAVCDVIWSSFTALVCFCVLLFSPLSTIQVWHLASSVFRTSVQCRKLWCCWFLISKPKKLSVYLILHFI